jgi:hypothetical protein
MFIQIAASRPGLAKISEQPSTRIVLLDEHAKIIRYRQKLLEVRASFVARVLQM